MSFRVIGVGEVLWDLLPSGPEMGGAPANFAYHAHALGARAGLITRVGRDPLGDDIRRRFEELRLPVNLIQTDGSAPTGTVTVKMVGDGIPQFTIHSNAAWDNLSTTDAALLAVSEADALCFGSLAQRQESARSTIQELLSRARPGSLRVFDVNLRQNFYTAEVIEKSLEFANVAKLNDAELHVLAGMFGLKGDAAAQVGVLAERFALELVALTYGPQGSLLYRNGRWVECKPSPVLVKDTVGAGDAFTAALVMGLLRKVDLQQIGIGANAYASFVCTCAGATPPIPDELRRQISGLSQGAPVPPTEHVLGSAPASL